MGTHPIFESDFDCLTVQDVGYVFVVIDGRPGVLPFGGHAIKRLDGGANFDLCSARLLWPLHGKVGRYPSRSGMVVVGDSGVSGVSHPVCVACLVDRNVRPEHNFGLGFLSSLLSTLVCLPDVDALKEPGADFDYVLRLCLLHLQWRPPIARAGPWSAI